MLENLLNNKSVKKLEKNGKGRTYLGITKHLKVF